MKKILLLMMCVLMALVVAGCGGSNEQKQTEKVLKVATDANFPPFEFYQARSDLHTGFDIGLMNAIAKEMGYDKVEYINVPFKDILPGLNEKKYDAAIAGITVTPERSKIVDFTNTYIESGIAIAVPVNTESAGDMNSLQGKRVAVEMSSVGQAMVQNEGNAAEIILVEATEDGLKLMEQGKADAVVADNITINFFIANGYRDTVKLASDKVLLPSPIAMAVAKGNTELQGKLNDALKEVRRSGEYKRVYNSYFGI